MPPAAWSVPTRPQPWYPHHPAVSVPPPPLGYAQQPLFPVQNVRPPLPSTTTPTLQPSQITPPGLPVSTPSVPASQPLFPVVGNNSIPSQSSPFSAPMLSTSIPSISASEVKGSIDLHLSANSSMTSNYQALNIPGWICFKLSLAMIFSVLVFYHFSSWLILKIGLELSLL